jgi:uncharacterized protein DUF1980
MRRDASALVAIAGGACFCAALTGVSGALTAIPGWAMAATGIALSVCALASASDRAKAAKSFVLGASIGLLPTTSPSPVRGFVVTRSVATTMRGDIFDALNRLDDDPSSLLGDRISVSGMWAPASREHLATISRRVMSCCAADVVDVGFDVTLARATIVPSGGWVRVDGIVGERIVDGEVRYILEHSVVRGLEDNAKSAP